MSSYYGKMLATGEVKCIDEEVTFEIPLGWEWCRLRDVIQLLSGRDLEPSMYNSSQKGIPYITGASNFNNENLIVNRWTQTPVTVSEEGDLLITCKGTIGTMAFNNIGSIHIARQIMAIHSKDVDLHYLKLYFELNIGTLESQANSMIPGISREVVLNSLVPIPPLQEQIKIVEKSNSLMPLVNKYSFAQGKLNLLNNVIKNKLEKTILQEAIKGKLVPQLAEEGTAQELLEQIKTEKQKLVKEGKLKKSGLATSVIFRGDDNKYYEQIGKNCVDITEEIPFEIPNNWIWARMGQVGDWGAGSTPQRGNQDYYGGNILWLKTGELNNDIVYDTEEKITQRAFQDCSLRMNKIGDVLIAMYGATIGKLAIVGKELTTNQACCGCTPYVVYNWFLFYFLMASRDSFIKKGEGGAQPNISRVKLVEHLIPLPPLNEQKRIVKRIETLFEQLH